MSAPAKSPDGTDDGDTDAPARATAGHVAPTGDAAPSDALDARLATAVHDVRDSLNVASINAQLIDLLVGDGRDDELDEALGALRSSIVDTETRLAALGDAIAAAQASSAARKR